MEFTIDVTKFDPSDACLERTYSGRQCPLEDARNYLDKLTSHKSRPVVEKAGEMVGSNLKRGNQPILENKPISANKRKIICHGNSNTAKCGLLEYCITQAA